MKLFTSALLVASSFLVSSCISCIHRSVSGTVTTTETTDMPEMPEAPEASTTPDSLMMTKEMLSKVYPTIGKVLKTSYYDFIVNKTKVTDNVSIIPNLMDIAPENGYRFLIVYLTIRNTDHIKRKNLKHGEVWICKGGFQYKFKSTGSMTSESSVDGLGEKYDHQDNSSILIYKIPKVLNGAAYFQPTALKMDERISLGSI